jgi:hypothetical protein
MTRLARCERHDIASLLAHIAEFDERKLYLKLGYSSLYTYCVEVLKLSTGEAYRRIEVARYARRYPMILDKIADGSLNLTTVDLVAPELKPADYHEILEQASGKTKREVQVQVAARNPRPFTRPARYRPIDGSPLPLSTGSTSSPPVPAPKPRLVVIPLSADTAEVRFEVTNATLDKLKKAQDLMRHAIRDGDPAEIFDRALTLLLKEVERKRCGNTDKPRPARPVRPDSDHIPAWIQRAVWKRDGGRCAFIGRNGRRCTETSCLQYHHVVARAKGGPTTVENIQLRCAAHNRYEAELAFGPDKLRPVGVVSEKRVTYRAGPTRAGVSSSVAGAHINEDTVVTRVELSYSDATLASPSRSARADPASAH